MEGCAARHTLWVAFFGTYVTWQMCFHCGLLIVLIRQVCSRFIPKGFMHQSVLPGAIVSIEMCTLGPDSLLTGLPGLVKATGSFSETKATHPFIPTTNVYPPLQLFIYLSIHVAFHFLLLFSAVFLPDPWSALKEACGFLAAAGVSFFSFFPPKSPRFFDCKDFFEASFNTLGSIKESHITRRSEFNSKPVWFKRLLLPPPGKRAAQLKV